jgi:hypothetical protein
MLTKAALFEYIKNCKIDIEILMSINLLILSKFFSAISNRGTKITKAKNLNEIAIEKYSKNLLKFLFK